MYEVYWYSVHWPHVATRLASYQGRYIFRKSQILKYDRGGWRQYLNIYHRKLLCMIFWNFISATMENGYRDYIGKTWKEFGDIHKIITGGYKILDANICVFRRSFIIIRYSMNHLWHLLHVSDNNYDYRVLLQGQGNFKIFYIICNICVQMYTREITVHSLFIFLSQRPVSQNPIPRSGEDNDGQLTKQNPGKLKRWGARG